jgi:hypothetical protein
MPAASARKTLRLWGIYAAGGLVDVIVGHEAASRRAVEVVRTLGTDVEVVEFAPVGEVMTVRRSACG